MSSMTLMCVRIKLSFTELAVNLLMRLLFHYGKYCRVLFGSGSD